MYQCIEYQNSYSYIDENGKYYCRMQSRNDFMLNMSDKLREEWRKNSEKLFEKTKQKATEKKEENAASNKDMTQVEKMTKRQELQQQQSSRDDMTGGNQKTGAADTGVIFFFQQQKSRLQA